MCGGVALAASAVQLGTTTIRYARGEVDAGALWGDVGQTATNVLGFGAGLRAASLFQRADAVRAAGANQWLLARWWANAQAFGLRLEGRAFWAAGLGLDVGNLGWGTWGSGSTIWDDIMGAC